MSSLPDSKTRLYRIWIEMRRRCSNPNRKDYAKYGAKGISVCKEWGVFLSFKSWALDNGYNDTLSIDRINNDGNYEPSNCRWATAKEQADNRKKSLFLEINGEKKLLIDFARDKGLNEATVYDRYARGVRGEDLFLPPQEHFSHTAESKRKISESLKGKLKGRVFSEETKKKMSEAKKGKYEPSNKIRFSEEDINNILELKRNGNSIYSISKKYNVDSKVIKRVIKETRR